MQKAVNKEKEQLARRTVTIVNSGKRTFKDSFDGSRLEIRPGYKASVPAEMAWLWFGDPDLRPDSPKGTVKDWNRELSRLESRHGYTGGTSPHPHEQQKLDEQRKASFWSYILEGNLYIKEWGRGAEWYRKVNQALNSEIIGVPIEPGDDGAGRHSNYGVVEPLTEEEVQDAATEIKSRSKK